MKINTKKIMLIFIFLMLFSLSGCGLTSAIVKLREEKLRKLYEEISQIESNPNYAFIHSIGYISNTEEINFNNLIEQKISQDKKKVKNLVISSFRMEGDIIFFFTKYKTQKRFFGINDENNYYAVGTFSLIDYTINIQYFNCEFEKIVSIGISETSYIFGMEDLSKKDKEGNHIHKDLTIDRKSGEVIKWDDVDSALKHFGEHIESYTNPTIYIEEGIQYEVSAHSISNEKSIIDVPTSLEVLEKSEEMKKIIDILGGETKAKNVKSYFFTNGDELFIGFYSKLGMFGYDSELTFPVIFKCDTGLQDFEYIGCVYTLNNYFYESLEIRKIN